jgi:hypothetical protein
LVRILSSLDQKTGKALKKMPRLLTARQAALYAPGRPAVRLLQSVPASVATTARATHIFPRAHRHTHACSCSCSIDRAGPDLGRSCRPTRHAHCDVQRAASIVRLHTTPTRPRRSWGRRSVSCDFCRIRVFVLASWDPCFVVGWNGSRSSSASHGSWVRWDGERGGMHAQSSATAAGLPAMWVAPACLPACVHYAAARPARPCVKRVRGMQHASFVPVAGTTACWHPPALLSAVCPQSCCSFT